MATWDFGERQARVRRKKGLAWQAARYQGHRMMKCSMSPMPCPPHYYTIDKQRNKAYCIHTRDSIVSLLDNRIAGSEKGKPREIEGRKATGPK